MWNFDKIQPTKAIFTLAARCGLMWNFDKIQLAKNRPTNHAVVV